jgi:hypothetical protein
VSDLSPELVAAFKRRYKDRPERLAEVLANAEAWEMLKEAAEEDRVEYDRSGGRG